MKKRFSKHIMGRALGYLGALNDYEGSALMKRDHKDPAVLRDIVQQYVVPYIQKYDEKSRQEIKNSMEYYLGTNSYVLDRVLPMFYVPLEPPSGREFFEIVWDELFKSPVPVTVNASDYVEDNSTEFINSLHKKEEGKGKKNLKYTLIERM